MHIASRREQQFFHPLREYSMLLTGDQQLLRQINRMVLVRKLLSESELSRADLAEAVGLTKSTVSVLIRELVDEGWICESEHVVTGSLGRRPTPLHVDETRLALLGADLGIDEIRIVATNLLGVVLDHHVVQYEDVSDVGACLKQLAQEMVRIARKLHAQDRSILGIGVGMHGGVDETAGVLHFAPNLGWRNIHAAGALSAHFAKSPLADLPLYVQNEADVSALAEFEFSSPSSSDPLIYLSIGYGVGAGVVVRDSLLTGCRGFAGEVGHMILQSDGPLCSCGRRGCAEALIGLGNLLKKTGQSIPERRQALQGLFAQVHSGKNQPGNAVEVAGRNLGILLNNLWVAFDPKRIVLGGPSMGLGDAFLGPARAVLQAYSEAAQLPSPEIQTTRYGDDAVAIGAAALVRYHLTRPLV
jgi:predicted NBD/HSP70 family sugar kinase/DNA-binding XRE family transcriptional regulator